MFTIQVNVRRMGLLAVLAAALQTRASTAADAKPTSCCFNNIRYAGVCVVTPSQDQTCSSILAYLNNPSSAGKTYCNNTSVRGGWKQTKCKP